MQPRDIKLLKYLLQTLNREWGEGCRGRTRGGGGGRVKERERKKEKERENENQ